MIVSIETSEFLKGFQEVLKTIERKLNNLARGFSYKIAQEAMNHTPLGNSQEYMDLYLARQQSTGLNPEEGFARGSWQVKKNANFSVQQMYGVNSGERALTVVSSSLENLTFRDNIYVGNRGYYIQALEGNHSKQTNGLGIKKPTLDAVMLAYSISARQLYDEG